MVNYPSISHIAHVVEAPSKIDQTLIFEVSEKMPSPNISVFVSLGFTIWV
jgi:hypothetical protein